MNTCRMAAMLALALGWSAVALAGDFYVYPNEGQNQEQQELDEFQCYGWAKNETGFDPMEAPRATEPPPQQEAKKGGVGRGALRGAAVGAVIDGSDGAKTGAIAGGAVGGMRRADQNRKQQQKQQQWEQEQVRQYEDARNNYNRAYSACLEARGYTVR